MSAALRGAAPAPLPRPHSPALPALIVGIALLARLVFALEAPPWITWPDGQQYEAVARSLLEHRGYGLQALRPPGYPTFMAAVWSVTGHDLRALRVVEALLGALAVAGVTWIGMRRFGRGAGLVAGAIVALHPVLAYLPSTQYTENTLVVLMVGVYGLVLAGLAPGGRRLGVWTAAGALLGLAMLWRPNMVLLLPGLLAGVAWRLGRTHRPTVAPVACLLLAAGVVLAPWIVRCHRVHGRWYLVATGGGRALWLGNNPRLAHGPYTITFPPEPALEARFHAQPGEFAYDEAMRREALANMRADPAGAVALYARKLGHLFALYPDTYTRSRHMNALARLAQALASAVLFGGALLALPALRRTPDLVPLVLGAAGFCLVTAVFFAVMRYRMPVEPVLAWLAGIGWAAIPAVRRLETR